MTLVPTEDPLKDPRVEWIDKLPQRLRETIDSLDEDALAKQREGIEKQLQKAKDAAAKKGATDKQKAASEATQKKLTEQQEAIDKKLHDHRVKSRYAFLAYFECTLGGPDAVKDYFSNQLVSFMTPGLVVHKTVAARMEGVRKDLDAAGIPFPETDVGQSLRGDHLKSKRERKSPGKLAHAMGWAVDWRAYKNPNVIDPRLHALIEGVTEEESRIDLPSWGPRREAIKAMGKATEKGDALSEEQNKHIQTIGTEFDRLKAASEEFRGSIPDDAKQELAAMHPQVMPLFAKVAEATTALAKAKARKGKNKATPEDLAVLQEAVDDAQKALKAKHDEIRPKLEKIFAKWREALAKRIAFIEKQGTDLGIDIRQLQPEDWLGPLRAEVKGGPKKEKGFKDKVVGIEKDMGRTTAAVATIRGQVDAFDGYLTAGAKGAKPADVTRWSTEVPPVKEAAQKTLAAAEALRAETAAFLGQKPPKPAAIPAIKPRRYADKDIEKWKKGLGAADAKVQAGVAQFPEAKKGLDEAVAGTKASTDRLAEFDKRNKEIKDKVGKTKFAWLEKRRKRLTYMEKVRVDLIEDLTFLFKETDVADPGVGQLLGAGHPKGGGFFEPNKEPETDIEKAQAKKLAETARKAPTSTSEFAVARGEMSRAFGFNKLFYQSMAKHGFDLGAAWDNSQDTMHFELVEGVETIKDPDTCPVPEEPAKATAGAAKAPAK